MENKAVFTDNEIQRSLLSKNFNFVLDKETGVSLCWGKDINDSPEYDPAFPQEISFKIDKSFNLNQMLKDFNFLANVKIRQINDSDNTKEFLPITDELEALTNENLVCLSTLGKVTIEEVRDLYQLPTDYAGYSISFKYDGYKQVVIND